MLVQRPEVLSRAGRHDRCYFHFRLEWEQKPIWGQWHDGKVDRHSNSGGRG
jgi:hypothetical protein